MALINCPECNREISDTVEQCPHCGYQLKKEYVEEDSKTSGRKFEVLRRNWKKIQSIIIIGCIVLIAFCGYQLLKPSDATKIVHYITVGKYNEAEERYKKVLKDKSKKEKTDNALIDQISVMYSQFKEGKVTEKNITEKLDNIIKMPVPDTVVAKANETAKNIHQLVMSQQAYEQGQKLQKKQDFVNANYSFAKVVKEDAHYKDAQKIIKQNKRELANKCVQRAQQYYNKKQFDNAVAQINQAYRYNASLENAALRDKYQKAQKKQEEQKKRLKKGDVIKGDGVKAYFKGATLTYKLLPTNTSDYYTYYSADKDEIFYAMKFNIKNISERDMDIEDLVESMAVKYDNKYTYDNYLLYYIEENGDISSVYSWDTIEPLRTATIYIVIDLPEKVKKTKKTIVTELEIAGKEKTYKFR